MMRRRIVCLAAVVLLSVSGGAFAQPQGAVQPCGVFTKADAAALFKGETFSDGRMRKTMLPAGESCQYQFSKKGGTFGITIRISTSQAIREEGINDSASDIFTRQKKARLSNAYAAKKFKEIKGLGDAAFWNGTDLWALQGDILVIVTARPALAGSFKNREAADTAQYEQSLSISQQAAKTVLSRLKQ